MTKVWIEVSDLLSGQYSFNKNIKFKTSMLLSDLCDYKDAYIFVKGTITAEKENDAKTRRKANFQKQHSISIMHIKNR